MLPLYITYAAIQSQTLNNYGFLELWKVSTIKNN